MGLKVYFKGEMVDTKEAKVSVFDHGLLYGDGVFEGIRSYNRKVFRLDEHIDRLYESAEQIRLKVPLSKKDFENAVLDTLKENDIIDGYIRAIITRGPGDLGLDPRKCPDPTVIIIADKIKLFPHDFYSKGLDIAVAKTRRTHPATRGPEIKSLNYLNNILARIEAIDAGKPEALMLTVDGYICEGSGENIFFLKNNKLFTPDPALGALTGITQRAVIELASERGIDCDFVHFTLDDLEGVQESFFTGTAAEIVPVVKIGDRVIGSGRPGKITSMLIEEYRKLASGEGVEY